MWFGVGLLSGGATTGFAMSLLAGLLPDVGVPLLLALATFGCLVAALRDGGRVGFWLPQNRRQVRRTVTELAPSVGSYMFGFELGTGVRTFLPGTAPYVAAAFAILAPFPAWFPLFVGVGFGLGRLVVALEYLVSQRRREWESAIRMSARSTTVFASIATGCLGMIVAVLQL